MVSRTMEAGVEDLPSERPTPVLLASALLFVSGACALVFQVVWTREFRLIFGATTAASAAVLAVFLAGLGIGNAWFGAWADRQLRPLRLYATLEGLVAGVVALTPFLLDFADRAYLATGGQAVLGPFWATAARLALTVAVLAAPTILMGGTMPAVARAVTLAGDTRRRSIAVLYAVNTFGAVVGAGLSGFWGIEQFGARATLWIASGACAALSVTAWWCAGRLTTRERQPDAASAPTSDARKDTTNVVVRPSVIYLASAVVGFAFFLMEIVWYRMLGPILGGTTYTFGLILCVALAGIGVGGALYPWLARRLAPTLGLFSVTVALEAIFVLFPYWLGDRIPLFILAEQAQPATSFAEQVMRWARVALVVIFPAALVAGFQFPLLIALAGQGRNDVGRNVGWVYAANTLGAIVGSLAGGFFLLPFLGATTVWVGVAWLLLATAWVMVLSRGRPTLGARIWLGAMSAGTLYFALGEGPTAVWRHAGIGAGRARVGQQGANALREFVHARRRQCVWQADGIESSVAIVANDSLSFLVNGKSDGNAISDASTQIGLGIIAPILNPNLRRGLVVGYGTGETAGWLADVAPMETVDVVELEPAVMEIARRLAVVNRNALQNPKIHVYFNDAREHIRASRQKYDVVVSEPSNPYRAGVASLYTREFYQAVENKLSDQGLFVQWLQAYEIDSASVLTALQTLRSVFPVIEIWQGRARDLLLVCGKSDQAFTRDGNALKARIANEPVLREALRKCWRVTDWEGFLAHLSCDASSVAKILNDRPAPINTDDRNRLEYAFAKTLGSGERFTLESWGADKGADATSYLRDAPAATEKIRRRRIALYYFHGGEIPKEVVAGKQEEELALFLMGHEKGQFAEASASQAKAAVDTTCPIEGAALAHVLAQTGQTPADDLLRLVEAISPAESACIAAILKGEQKQPDAKEALFTAIEKLRQDPWVSTTVMNRFLRRIVAASETDPALAKRLFDALGQPFAADRAEDFRLLTRYLLAETVGDLAVIQALRPLEPNVPWKGFLLERRARAYVAINHPFAGRAEQDWAWFSNYDTK